MQVVKPKPLLELVKSMLEEANPGVRKAAVEVLVTVRRQLGPDVRAMVADVKPALLATIDEAFAKVADEVPAEVPKRQVSPLPPPPHTHTHTRREGGWKGSEVGGRE